MTVGRFLRRPALRGVGAGLAGAVVAGLLANTNIARGLDDWLFDGCFVNRDLALGPNPDPGPVVVVGLYEKDFDALAKPAVFISPELAEVVTHARKSGATAVGVDLIIPNSLWADHKQFFREVGNPVALGRAVRAADKVVLPVMFPAAGPPAWPIEQWLLKYRNPDYQDPLGRDVANIDMFQDGDRFVRQANILVPGPNGEPFPGFPLALAAWAEDKPYRWDEVTKTAWLGDVNVPLGPRRRMAINWAGRPGTFPVVPFTAVLEAARAGRTLPELNGKVAIVGSMALDAGDFRPTPYSNAYAHFFSQFGADTSLSMAGPEIHAHAVATLLKRSFVTTPGWLSRWPWLLAVGAGLGWVLARLSPLPGLAVVLAYMVGWQAFATAALAAGNWRADLVAMLLLAPVVVYTTAFILRWRVVRRVLAATKSLALAKALEADPGRLDLAGQNRELSVMFVDVRGFSDFSSRFRDDPQRIVAVLNAYYAAVVPGVEAEGGTVNLFIGDGMMVLFNAPLDHPDHARRAVRAARGLVRAVRENRGRFAALGFPDFRVGVGVNTGVCTVGAVGSPSRLDYTAIGDVVNAAARLESATKEARVDVLIGAGTVLALDPADRAALGCAAEPREMVLKGVGTVPAYPVAVD